MLRHRPLTCWYRSPGRWIVAVVACAQIGALAAAADMLPGDADCNGVVDRADITAIASAIFVPTSCVGTDANGDKRTTAADLVAGVKILASPSATPTVTQSPSATLAPT